MASVWRRAPSTEVGVIDVRRLLDSGQPAYVQLKTRKKRPDVCMKFRRTELPVAFFFYNKIVIIYNDKLGRENKRGLLI